MKLPRWLVIGMLTSSVMVVATAAGCWWAAWPEQTAHEFSAAMAAENWNRARAMMAMVPQDNIRRAASAWELLDPCQWKSANMKPEPRTIRDIYDGRQTFGLPKYWRMTVEQNKVKMVGLQKILISRNWPRRHTTRKSKLRPHGERTDGVPDGLILLLTPRWSYIGIACFIVHSDDERGVHRTFGFKYDDPHSAVRTSIS